LKDYLPLIEDWCKLNRLEISPLKLTLTLLTPDPGEYSKTIDLKINNISVPTNKTPKILGLHLDPKLTFSTHTQYISQKASRRLQPLKALASHTWGQDRDTLLLIYKQYIRSIIEYASPAWHPTLAPSNLNKLQTLQNHALRIITGCTLMTPIPHLHHETKTLPIAELSDMIGTQFFAKLSQPGNPSEHLTINTEPPRKMKTTPAQKYLPLLEKYTQIQTHPNDLVKTIHTNYVDNYLTNPPINALLGEPPPEISPSESKLSRKERVILSQLRSNYSPLLHDYLHRINKTPSNLCRFCDLSPETPFHIFQSCTHPLLSNLRLLHNITPHSLWLTPERVLAFLTASGLWVPSP
jgi:hypothetical protein